MTPNLAINGVNKTQPTTNTQNRGRKVEMLDFLGVDTPKGVGSGNKPISLSKVINTEEDLQDF